MTDDSFGEVVDRRGPEVDGPESADSLAHVLEVLNADLDELVAARAPRVPLPEPGEGRPIIQRVGTGARLTLAAGLLAAAFAAVSLMESPPDSIVPAAQGDLLDVQADRPFVVFKTENPDLAIVWLLDEPESEE